MEKIKSFEEFKNAVLEGIREYLPDTFANAEISLQMVTKNNDVRLTGLLIKSADTNICPNIYLEKFYEDYRNDVNFEDILKHIVEIRMRNEFNQEFNTDMITDFNKACNHILPKLINADSNKILLSERPNTKIADLGVIYYIELGSHQDGTMSAPITNQMLNKWNVSVEQIHEYAIKNLSVLEPASFKSMAEVMGDMMRKDLMAEYNDEDIVEEMLEAMMPQEGGMYVLTNSTKLNGAAVILDELVMNNVIEKIGHNFYILPSSIHELLIVPESAGVNKEALESMVREVNASELSKEEILSNNVYTWTKETGLVIA